MKTFLANMLKGNECVKEVMFYYLHMDAINKQRKQQNRQCIGGNKKGKKKKKERKIKLR